MIHFLFVAGCMNIMRISNESRLLIEVALLVELKGLLAVLKLENETSIINQDQQRHDYRCLILRQQTSSSSNPFSSQQKVVASNQLCLNLKDTKKDIKREFKTLNQRIPSRSHRSKAM
jgi:hypothetical protein